MGTKLHKYINKKNYFSGKSCFLFPQVYLEFKFPSSTSLRRLVFSQFHSPPVMVIHVACFIGNALPRRRSSS